MIPMSDLRPEEEKAIDRLGRLANKWPETLWLFVGGGIGNIYVMRKNDEGQHAVLSNGAVDPAYIAATIGGIDADGGDW